LLGVFGARLAGREHQEVWAEPEHLAAVLLEGLGASCPAQGLQGVPAPVRCPRNLGAEQQLRRLLKSTIRVRRLLGWRLAGTRSSAEVQLSAPKWALWLSPCILQQGWAL